MKNLFKYIGILCVAGLAASCAKVDDYKPADAPEGAQVYFPSSIRTAYTSSLDLESIDVPVYRIADDAAADIAIAVSDTTKDHLFFPAGARLTAKFAAGSKQTTVSIPVNHGQLTAGSAYAINLTVSEETTIYAASSVKIVLTVPEPWNYLGMATICDNLVAGYYTFDPLTYEVPCYTNALYPGSYFLKNAYTSLYPKNAPGDYVEGDTYFRVDVIDEEHVYIPYQQLGMAWSDGAFSVVSYISKYFKIDEGINYGKIENGVIKFAPKTILISEANYNNGAFYQTNSSGKFAIALPGAALTDYTIGIAYGGMQVSPSGDAALIVNFTSEADAVSAKYALAKDGDAEELIAAVLAGEEDGDVTFVEGVASDIIWDLEPGIYTVVAVPCDADGELKADYAASAKIRFNGLAPSSFELKLGVYSYTNDAGTFSLTFMTNPEDPTDYLVKNPSGLPDGSQWHLTLDEAARTLTCEGLELGYEEYENQFGWGWIYDWYNQAYGYAYGYLSIMEDINSEDGDAPLVFTLDDSGYVTGIQNVKFGAFVYQAESLNNITGLLGWSPYSFNNDTEFTYEGVATASVKAQNLVENRPIQEFSKSFTQAKTMSSAKIAGKSRKAVSQSIKEDLMRF
ncbi:MAG: hypothetical protein MJY92_00845 [Bacteroidales bacterium]|nr:hypothetical protein [Bacteroidales bacterium]